MAYFKFADKITKGEAIDVYNNGDMKRDFTYIDDIIDGIQGSVEAIPNNKKGAPYRIFNIGNNNPENLMDMIEHLENTLGKKAQKNMLPMQPGDVYTTYADIDSLKKETGFTPTTDLKSGLEKFSAWYKDFYSRESVS